MIQRVVAMLAEIFMMRLEAAARVATETTALEHVSVCAVQSRAEIHL